MDANKDGTIDMEEWEKFMTEELKAAIQSKLDDSGRDQARAGSAGPPGRLRPRHPPQRHGHRRQRIHLHRRVQERPPQGSPPGHVVQTQREGTHPGDLNAPPLYTPPSILYPPPCPLFMHACTHTYTHTLFLFTKKLPYQQPCYRTVVTLE